MRKMVVLVASVVTAMLLASSWLLLPGVARPAEAELAGAGPFTEDGKIAFVNYSPDGLEIQTLNSDGTDRSSFTPPISNASKPTWSPDGTKLALVKPTGAEPDFVIARADGTGLTSVPHACDFVEQQRGSVYWR